MAHGWTPERRMQQSLAIQQWSPWERASGPKTKEGKARSSLNAFKGGRRAKLRADIAEVRAWIREMDEDAVC